MTVTDAATFLDEMPEDGLSGPPGAELARVLESLIPFTLGDGELMDALVAFRRLTSWAQAGELAVIAELGRRRPAGAYERLANGSSTTGEFLIDEVEAALTLTGTSAAYLVELALTLDERLPATLEAMRAGLIDYARAKVIAQGTSAVTARLAGQVEREVLDAAPRLTTSELRSKVARAVIAADPEAADNRRKAAEAKRDVACHEERDGTGTATLTGRHLPADQAVAAANRLNAIARAFKADGDSRRLGAIRADVMLALLLGLLPTDLHTQARIGADIGPHPQSQPPAGPDSQTQAAASPDFQTQAATSPQPQTQSQARATADPQPRPTGPHPQAKTPTGSDSQTPSTIDPDPQAPLGHRSQAQHTNQDTNRSRDGNESGTEHHLPPDASPSGSDNPPARPGTRPHRSPPDAPERVPRSEREEPLVFAPERTPPPERPEITPWCDHQAPVPVPAPAPAPEEIPLPEWPDDDLADADADVARMPHQRDPEMRDPEIQPWYETVAQDLGQDPYEDGDDAPAPWAIELAARAGARVGTVNLTIPLTTFLGLSDQPADIPGYGPILADAARLLADNATRPGSEWCVTILDDRGTPIQHGETGYRPSPALRRKIEARNPTCVFPQCRRPARACDLDHTIPYGDTNGITCGCNLAPLCRRHHRVKQSTGWQLDQIQPGHYLWTTPSGKRYHCAPEERPL